MLYANTDDGSSALWVLDNDGVVVDNISIYGAERAPILEQINEHYGTSFTGWSDNEIGLRFGDSLPNWNAYEKIELERQKIATNIGGPAPNDAYMVGVIVGKSFNVLAGESGGCNTKSDGLVIAYSGPTAQNADAIIGILGNYGFEIDSVSNEIVNYEIGTYIPNWSEYEIKG